MEGITVVMPLILNLKGNTMKRLFPFLALLLVSLSGLAQAAHQTVITITPPAVQSGVTITRYDIFKATVSGGYNFTTPYGSVNAGATATTPVVFTDTTPVQGQTSFFVTRAVCPTCTTTVSANSNEISGTTPVDTKPNPPTISGVWQ